MRRPSGPPATTAKPPRPPASDARWPVALSLGLAIFSLLAGLFTIAGQTLGWRWAVDWVGSGITMKGNAGLATAALGLGLLLVIARPRSRAARSTGAGLALAGALLSALTLSEHVTGWDLGIDTLLWNEPVGAAATAAPGRMGPPASFCLTLLGASIVGLAAGRGRGGSWISVAALFAAAWGLLAVTGYLFGAETLYSVPKATGVSFQLATILVGLGLGVACAPPLRGAMAVLAAPGPGGTLARRLVLAVIGVPVLAGAAGQAMIRAGYADAAFAIALITVAMVAVLGGLTLAVSAAVERAAALQRATDDRFRAMADGLPLIVWVHDAEGKLEFVNATFCEFFGVTREEMKAGRWRLLIHPDDEVSYVREFLSCVAERRPFHAETRVRVPDGSWRWMESWARPRHGAHGEFLGFVGTSADATESRARREAMARHADDLQKAVAAATRELERSHRALALSERMASLGTFAAGLGHDMGNALFPLRALLADLRGRDDLPADAAEDLVAIERALNYLTSLSRGLRHFAADPHAPVDPDARDARVDPAALWQDIAPFIRSSLPRGVQLEFTCAQGCPPAAISPAALSQALVNLVQNARDAIVAARGPDARGRVEVRAEPGSVEGTVAISVRDDGGGMTEEVRRRCLEPFFTTRARQRGTGLGLAMVHGIVAGAWVENGGGSRAGEAFDATPIGANDGAAERIQIESSLGRGATLRLILPEAPAPRDAQARSAMVTIAEPRLAAFARTVARRAGLTIVENGDGIAAGEHRALKDGVIFWITDAAGGARAGGPEAAREFLAASPERRVVVLTGGHRSDEWRAAGALMLGEHATIADLGAALGPRAGAECGAATPR